MAGKSDLDFSYTTIDKIFRLSMGENADYSGARYEGDFSLTLEQAQRKKHKFICDNLDIKAGTKVLDLACGWGPFLNYLREIKAIGTGVTLSTGQAQACQANGLDVHVMDCRYVKPDTFGPPLAHGYAFDNVTCIGGLEHFCSIEEYKAGKQDEIYHDFFKTVYALLPPGRRIYIQTMTFGKNMIPLEQISLDSPRDSDSYALALMIAEFPGSWASYGAEHVERVAGPEFKLINKSSGRLDYIETIGQWRKRLRKFNLQKYALYASLVPKFITDKKFRDLIEVFKISPNRVCFEREVMDHFRIVFEKV